MSLILVLIGSTEPLRSHRIDGVSIEAVAVVSLQDKVPLLLGGASCQGGVRHIALAGGGHYGGGDEEDSSFPVFILPGKEKYS